jgi:hypothetical protein
MDGIGSSEVMVQAVSKFSFCFSFSFSFWIIVRHLLVFLLAVCSIGSRSGNGGGMGFSQVVSLYAVTHHGYQPKVMAHQGVLP